MKTKTILIIISMLLFLPAFRGIAQKTDMSGEWKLNKEKSIITDNQLFLAGITIQLKTDSILTTRVYQNGNGEEYPFDEKISLDGKECKISIYDMPRTSTATRSDADGSINIKSTTSFTSGNGQEDMTANETWKLDAEGQVLVLQFTNKMSGNESTGTYYFNKVIK